MHKSKPTIHIPYDVLPESHTWAVGKAYRVRVVLRQTGTNKDGATFEIIDAASLEPSDKKKRYYLTEGGYQFSND